MRRRTRDSAFVLLVLVVLSCDSHAARAQESEHLPRRSRPPLAGELPAGLAPYGARVAVPPRNDSDRRFDRLVDDILCFALANDPVRASELGFVQYDALLPATDSLGLHAARAELERLRARLDSLDSADLDSTGRRVDFVALCDGLAACSLELREGRPWCCDPASYPALVTRSLRALLDRTFPPLEERVWNVLARLTAVPGVFRDARSNLGQPSRAATEAAIRKSIALEHDLADALPLALVPVRDPVAREEFDHHLASATGSVSEYRHWLETVLLARSDGPERGPPAGVYTRTIERLLAVRRVSRME